MAKQEEKGTNDASRPAWTVAAVIPAYNAEAYVGRAIDSVLAQTHQPDEIIVVDDGSTDDTAAAVQAYADRVTLIRQQNSGASAARNAGIQAAGSTWIAFLDADDEWLPQRLETQLALLQRNPELVWATADFVRRSKSGDTRDYPLRFYKEIDTLLDRRGYFESYFQAYALAITMWTGCMTIRRNVLIGAGLFSSGLQRLEDEDLWLRIAYDYPQIGYVQEPLAVYYEQTPKSLVKRANNVEFVCRFMDTHLKLSQDKGLAEEFVGCGRRILCYMNGVFLKAGRGQEVRRLLREYADLYGGNYCRTTWWKSLCPPLGVLYNRLKAKMRRAE